MTQLETETVITGSFLLAGLLAHYGREALKRNWVKGSFSVGITTPDQRWPKPRTGKKQAPPEAAAESEPGNGLKSLREAS